MKKTSGANSAKSEISEPEPSSSKKVRYTVNLPEELIERAKNAAWATRKPFTTIAEQGLRKELERLEKQNGGPFPQRPGDLPAGRPLS